MYKRQVRRARYPPQINGIVGATGSNELCERIRVDVVRIAVVALAHLEELTSADRGRLCHGGGHDRDEQKEEQCAHVCRVVACDDARGPRCRCSLRDGLFGVVGICLLYTSLENDELIYLTVDKKTGTATYARVYVVVELSLIHI